MSTKAQDTCSFKISGTINAKADTETLVFANVVVTNENNEFLQGDISNENGLFEIEQLCAGNYHLKVSYIGFSELDTFINVKENKFFNIKLENATNLSEIVISEKKTQTGTLEKIAIKDIDITTSSTAGNNLAGMIANLPGVSFMKTSTNASKPVIHGLHGNRILILNNGVRQEGQQWNMNYAPEIDPFLASEIAVVQGASSVRYGADAIGGVILVDAPLLKKTKGIDGNILMAGRTNNRQGTISGMLQGFTPWEKLPISWRIQGTTNRGGTVHTPDYYLENTGFSDYSYSYALGYEAAKWGAEIFYSKFKSSFGVYKGSHTHTASDVLDIFWGLTPPDTTQFSYAILRPRENASHELFKAKTYYKPNENGKLSLTFARQFNRHDDFDIIHAYNVVAEGDPANMNLKLTVHSLNIDYEQKVTKKLTVLSGLSGLRKRNTTRGLTIIPRYMSHTAGAFLLTEYRPTTRLFFDAGVRYDVENRQIELEDSEVENVTYHNFSFSLGNTFNLHKYVKLQTNLGSAYRPPSVNELYSDGVNHGEGSFERGNPILQSERVYNATTSLNFDNYKNFQTRFSVFYKYFPNYIYLTPSQRNLLTIRGYFPMYEYVETQARFSGFDYSIQYNLPKNLSAEAQFSMIRAWNINSQEPLILIPPNQFSMGIGYELPTGDFAGSSLKIGMLHQAQQTLYPDSTHLILPPPAYTLFNIEGVLKWQIKIQKNKFLPIQIGLSIENVLNTRYRIYLNRMRYFADEAGRNISLKLKIPLHIN